MEKEYLTDIGFKKITEQLKALKGPGRKAVAEKLAKARSFGDLSENAEYDAAKHEQNILEKKIYALEDILSHATVVEKPTGKLNSVVVGARVLLEDQRNKAKINYNLVGSYEMELEQDNEDNVSVNSPVGKALVGKKVNELVEIQVPAGHFKYKVLKIE